MWVGAGMLFHLDECSGRTTVCCTVYGSEGVVCSYVRVSTLPGGPRCYR